LGSFDLVALHGVYTWVGPAVREEIVEFLRSRLAPGGYCYVSYNTMPGWAAFLPVQRLMKEFAMRAPGDALQKLAAARKALARFEAASTGYLERDPAVKRRLASLGSQAPAYLVHEYLNEHWEPLYASDVHAAMATAGLAFVGSATI